MELDMASSSSSEIKYNYLFRRRGTPVDDDLLDDDLIADPVPDSKVHSALYDQNILSGRFYTLFAVDKKAGYKWERYEWTYFTPYMLYWFMRAAHHCTFCGVELTSENASLDRIDNSKHHTADNIHVTCINCNVARSDYYSVPEFKVTCINLLKMRKMPIRPGLADEPIRALDSYDTKAIRSEEYTSVCTKMSSHLISHNLPSRVRRVLENRFYNRDLTHKEKEYLAILLGYNQYTDWIDGLVSRESPYFAPFHTYKAVADSDEFNHYLEPCAEQLYFEMRKHLD